MSYDVNVYVDDECVFDVNYTSNMAGAWDEAGILLRDWGGKPIAEIIDALREGVAKINVDREPWRRFDAPNGWGSIDGMMERFIEPLLAACEANPKGTIRVSR